MRNLAFRGLRLLRLGAMNGAMAGGIVSVGPDSSNYIVVQAENGVVEITISTPAVFAGTYTVNLDGLSTGPISLLNPVVTGVVAQSEVLTVRSLWIYDNNVASPAITYQWQRNGVAISGATTSTYTIATADAGTAITVVASATDANGTRTDTSLAVQVVFAYTQKTFRTGTGDQLSGTVAAGATKILFGAWITRPTFNFTRLFQINSGTSFAASSLGVVGFTVNLETGAQILNFNPTTVVPTSGKVFVGAYFDIVAGEGTVRVGSSVANLNAAPITNGDTINSGALRVFNRIQNDRRFDGNFSDVVLQLGGANTLDDLYNNGVPPDVSGLTAEVILGGSMVLANFNSVPPVQLGTIPLTSLNNIPTFIEVT